MVSETPTMTGLLIEPETTSNGRLARTIQITLVIYLIPVIALVTAIGVLAIMAERLMASITTAQSSKPRPAIRTETADHHRLIGSRPITTWKQPGSRVIR